MTLDHAILTSMKPPRTDDVTKHVYSTLTERFGPPLRTRQIVNESAVCDQCGMMHTELEGAGCPSDMNEKAPPGREKQVKALKKDPNVDNPFAVAWSSYNKKHEGVDHMDEELDERVLDPRSLSRNQTDARGLTRSGFLAAQKRARAILMHDDEPGTNLQQRGWAEAILKRKWVPKKPSQHDDPP